MGEWKYKIRLSHIIHCSLGNAYEQSDLGDSYEDTKKKMELIADEIQNHPELPPFILIDYFRNIPEGNCILNYLDYSNKLLEFLFEFADENSIWIE